MTPLPKRKTSKGRRDRRRAHDALTPLATTTCPNCGEQRLPHRVCPNCGFYKGREVVKMAKE
jgi:large subunit ribosomal protein L32